jgi:hypothetical protein
MTQIIIPVSTAQRAMTDPSSDTESTLGRVGDLLAVVYVQSQTLDAC